MSNTQYTHLSRSNDLTILLTLDNQTIQNKQNKQIIRTYTLTFLRSVTYLRCLMHWIILLLASLFEIGFATCLGKLKTATGNQALLWFSGFSICLVLSVYLLYKATQSIPIGTAYAIWTGLGAAGIVLVGILVFKEPATFWRMFFLTSLIMSIVGLKFVS